MKKKIFHLFVFRFTYLFPFPEIIDILDYEWISR